MERQKKRHQGKKKEREKPQGHYEKGQYRNQNWTKRQREEEIQNKTAGEGGKETLSAEKKKQKTST